MIFKQQNYYAGLYARFSDEDEQESESSSIESQKKILLQYCESKGIKVSGFYMDDGFSGTNFDRPGFGRMLDDIEMGKVNLVITKDLSRFGRNYVEVGRYIEQVFDDYNVRYIAIDDNVDTLQGENMVMPIKNIMNDWYAKDISKKTKSSLNARARSGQYLASKPAYGYAKSPDNNHQLIIDPEAAEVVKQIFTLASSSHGYNSIVKHLTRSKILTPQSYFVLANPNYFKNATFEPHCDWNNKTVNVILNNPIYLGHTIYGKTRSKKIRSKVRISRPEEDWIVRENTHEPIISKELWDAAHEMLDSRKKACKNGKVHIFSGFLYCKDCGAAMTFNNRDLGKEHNGEYVCGTYKRKGKGRCTTHYITFEDVYTVILQDIRSKATFANHNEKRFMDSLEKESEKLQAKKNAHLLKDVQQAKDRVIELDQIINSLFEKQALGVIPSDRFDTMFMKYDAEQKELQTKISEAVKIQMKNSGRDAQRQRFLKFIKETIDVTALDEYILSKLIKRITVGQASVNPITGEKQQAIEVELAVC